MARVITENLIRDWLVKGENASAEFKRARKAIPDNFWETYSAFANTDGGVIVLGIDEPEPRKYVLEERHEKVLSKQVLRSGTSIGANVAEGLFGASHADFINKYAIALKEANETHYWLTLLKDTNYLPVSDATDSLIAECNAIVSILAACVKTAKQKGAK